MVIRPDSSDIAIVEEIRECSIDKLTIDYFPVYNSKVIVLLNSINKRRNFYLKFTVYFAFII